MSEEVNDDRWQELCTWAEEEWVGGASVNKKREDLLFYAATGTPSFKFMTYKHGAEPRTLYGAVLNVPSLGTKGNFVYTFTDSPLFEGDPCTVPDTLEEFITLFFRYAEAREGKNNPIYLRNLRNWFKEVKADPGYPSLAEVYEYTMRMLRLPVQHAELHSDIADYEESLNVEAVSKKISDKVNRTLALFLQWVRAFKPDFTDWSELDEVLVTADNPVWKGGGGGILKIANDLEAYFPLTVSTAYSRNLSLKMPEGWHRKIEREVNVKRAIADQYKYNQIGTTNAREAVTWQGPAFFVEINGHLAELSRTLRFRFLTPEAVPSVASLAGVHSFKKISSGQVADVLLFARTAEMLGLDNPVGRGAAIRQGAMGYARPENEGLYFDLEESDLKELLRKAWEEFTLLFAPPEHYELHTDTGSYEEALVHPSVETSVMAIPEDIELVKPAVEKWNRYPQSEASTNKDNNYCNFRREFDLTHSVSGRPRYVLSVGLYFDVKGAPVHVILDPARLQFPDWHAVPDDPEYLRQAFLRDCREDSADLDRLKAVKPVTAAHWARQFLLGINLEKKVPESAFPSKPVAALPAYFDKFRASPLRESDLRLTLAADLSLLGE